jgi:hypothetical protein
MLLDHVEFPPESENVMTSTHVIRRPNFDILLRGLGMEVQRRTSVVCTSLKAKIYGPVTTIHKKNRWSPDCQLGGLHKKQMVCRMSSTYYVVLPQNLAYEEHDALRAYE